MLMSRRDVCLLLLLLLPLVWAVECALRVLMLSLQLSKKRDIVILPAFPFSLSACFSEFLFSLSALFSFLFSSSAPASVASLSSIICSVLVNFSGLSFSPLSLCSWRKRKERKGRRGVREREEKTEREKEREEMGKDSKKGGKRKEERRQERT